MKKIIFLLILILFACFTFAETSSSSINWASHRYVNENFCALNTPSCIFLGNITFLGDVFNLTVTNVFINATTIVGLNETITEVGNNTYIKRTGDTGLTGTYDGDYNLSLGTGNVQATDINATGNAIVDGNYSSDNGNLLLGVTTPVYIWMVV